MARLAQFAAANPASTEIASEEAPDAATARPLVLKLSSSQVSGEEARVI